MTGRIGFKKKSIAQGYHAKALAYGEEFIRCSSQAAADTEVRGSEDESQDIQQSEAPADKDPGAEKDCSADQTQPDATGLEERANAVGEKKEHLKSQAKRRQALVKAVQVSAQYLLVSVEGDSFSKI